ncbi:MAG: SH3 domain-containing protein [Chloroflexota bacterium]
MHKTWEEMLPFYAAGSLPKADVTRLEFHLAHCNECSKSLEDWRRIAGAVRAEASSQMRDLPPLADELLQAISQPTGSPPQYRDVLPIRQVSASRDERKGRRFSATSVTLVAAAFTVLLLGGLLALLVMNGTQQPSTGVALLPSETATATLDATGQPETQATQLQPQIIVIEPSETLTHLLPTALPPTNTPTRLAPTPPPTFSAEQALVQISAVTGAGCTLEAVIPRGSVINLYARPRTDSTVLTTISAAEELTALATSDNSWYQLQSALGNVGWVQQGLVAASGNCDGLPLILAEMATEIAVTLTDVVQTFPNPATLTPTPEITVPPDITVTAVEMTPTEDVPSQNSPASLTPAVPGEPPTATVIPFDELTPIPGG